LGGADPGGGVLTGCLPSDCNTREPDGGWTGQRYPPALAGAIPRSERWLRKTVPACYRCERFKPRGDECVKNGKTVKSDRESKKDKPEGSGDLVTQQI